MGKAVFQGSQSINMDAKGRMAARLGEEAGRRIEGALARPGTQGRNRLGVLGAGAGLALLVGTDVPAKPLSGGYDHLRSGA